MCHRGNLTRVSLILLICSFGWLSTLRGQDSESEAEAELTKVREINAGVPDPSLVLRDLTVTAQNAALLPRYYENIARIRKQFGNKLDIRQQPYSELKFSLDHHERTVKQFEQSIRDNAGSPQLVQQDLDLVGNYIKIAIDNQAPAWFSPENSLYKTLATARSRVEIVKALGGDKATLDSLGKNIAESESKVAAAAASLSKQILESAVAPPDDYRGPDRDKLLEMVVAKWKADGTGQTIVKQGIVASNWDRSVRWEWRNSAFHKSDTSRIQGYVLVMKDKQLAVRHSVNFVLDHLDGDKLYANWVNDPKAEQPLNAHILMSKLQ